MAKDKNIEHKVTDKAEVSRGENNNFINNSCKNKPIKNEVKNPVTKLYLERLSN